MATGIEPAALNQVCRVPPQPTSLQRRSKSTAGPADLSTSAVLDRVLQLAEAANAQDVRTMLGRYDHVTLLPNRLQFLDDHRICAEATADRELILVTTADAKQFNEILRALGHSFAEDFVRAAAARIAAALPPDATLYHVSVLSFAFVIRADPTSPPAVVRDLLRSFRAPITCNDIPVTSRLGVGIVRIAAGSRPTAEIMRSAMAAAQDGRASQQQWAHYDRRTDEAQLRAFRLLTDMQAAIEADDQMSLVYQPRVDLGTGRIESAEVLLRWNHPALGAVSPAEFVPLAETTALIGPLTSMVLAGAARQSALWRGMGLDVKLSANVSPGSLHRGDFVDDLSDILDREGVSASRFELEFTEGVLASSDAVVLRQIERIQDLAISIAIDDFGTGYSNMEYLTRLPMDVLKIDRSFVTPLEHQPRHQLLVKSIIDMAHGFGYRVVAEGIETPEVYGLLADWGCDEGQGYLMSRPLAPAAFADWVFALDTSNPRWR